MSSMYYIGSFEKNKDNIFLINKPLSITGNTCWLLEDVLNYCGVDAQNNFVHCETDDWFKPLFWKETAEFKNMKPYELEYDEDDYKTVEDMEFLNYPLICDGVERNGVSYYIDESMVKNHDYSNFKDKFNNYEEFKTFCLSQKDYNHNDVLIKSVYEAFKSIKKCILKNKMIYFYRYQ